MYYQDYSKERGRIGYTTVVRNVQFSIKKTHEARRKVQNSKTSSSRSLNSNYVKYNISTLSNLPYHYSPATIHKHPNQQKIPRTVQ